jgi:outer membrane protein OmpA-like peptidoglycan-associated protein
MKRILLCAALCAALSLAHSPFAQAQWRHEGPDLQDEVVQLEDQLDRLRRDADVLEFAPEELARAEEYIEALGAEPPYRLSPADIEEAGRLLARTERRAQRRAERNVGREVVVVEDDSDERQAWDEAEHARSDAERARAEAETERERALAAQLEAEHERNEAARLRSELGEAQTRVTERGLVLTLGDVLFAVGKSDLKPGAARTLDKLVAAMKRDRETTVAIEGHTDSTGKHAYNVALSKRRADAVRAYLAARGIPASRITARGLGPDYPVATNGTEAGRQQNRRVEVLVQNDAFDDE